MSAQITPHGDAAAFAAAAAFMAAAAAAAAPAGCGFGGRRLVHRGSARCGGGRGSKETGVWGQVEGVLPSSAAAAAASDAVYAAAVASSVVPAAAAGAIQGSEGAPVSA